MAEQELFLPSQMLQREQALLQLHLLALLSQGSLLISGAMDLPIMQQVLLTQCPQATSH